MPAKPNSRNWNDVQTAIATVTVVTTLGLWNLFAQPSKPVTAQSADTVTPPPPTETPAEPTAMPQVKIMFTQVAPQSSVVTTTQQQTTTKKNNMKNNNNNSGGGGGSTVTQTKTS